MRIGIITHHYVANYGAFLQAYALQKAVESLCPEDEVYVVDRVNARHGAINALGWLRRAGGWRIPGMFARERRRCLRLSPRAGSADRLNEMGFDALIVGSDEVWNLADRKSFDPVKYGVGLRGALIAYAPSAGQTRADALGGDVKEGIMRFAHLSARDDAAVRLVEAAGREAVRVLDPVFLCPPPWTGEAGASDTKVGDTKVGGAGKDEPFMLAYAAGDWPRAARKSIVRWARAKRMRPWEEPAGLPPFAWAGRFGASGCVATGSFHGTVLAILAHKPFLCYTENPSRRAKLVSLLAELGLKERWLSPESDAARQMERPVDWARVDALLREKREASWGYLKRSLDSAREKRPLPRVYAAAAKDPRTLAVASSGGVFAVLARRVLAEEGCVFGCALVPEGGVLRARHVAARSEEELQALMGSKYVQSDLGDAFPRAKAALDAGRSVLFSGTPCQIAALRKFLGRPYERLLAVDVVCHGVPEARLFEDALAEAARRLGGPVAGYRFRDKARGQGMTQAVTVRSVKKTKTRRMPGRLTGYMGEYLRSSTYRERCYACPYAGRSRAGDITLGDFWGAAEEHGQALRAHGLNAARGVSLVIVSTERGRERFEAAMPELRWLSSDMERAARHNGCLNAPTPRPACRDRVMDVYRREGYAAMRRAYLREMGPRLIAFALWDAVPKGIRQAARRLMGKIRRIT
ncbi:MAG: Coenzyme F420 hydrogenase/dehydrogenase, beta subunit C-terminal domain [Clostridia bacterium]|nr:Coenzyme F420 hydrogenase/dehydrogenase, beta subunit C-terminal domain [Clostridia bacterium]